MLVPGVYDVTFCLVPCSFQYCMIALPVLSHVPSEVLCPGGMRPERGVSVKGVSIQGGSLYKGSLSRGICLQGSVCPGDLLTGGSLHPSSCEQTDGVKTLPSHSVYNNERVLPAETRYRVAVDPIILTCTPAEIPLPV